MMNFVEKLAPIQMVGVVSCRTDVMPIYKGMFDSDYNFIHKTF